MSSYYTGATSRYQTSRLYPLAYPRSTDRAHIEERWSARLQTADAGNPGLAGRADRHGSGGPDPAATCARPGSPDGHAVTALLGCRCRRLRLLAVALPPATARAGRLGRRPAPPAPRPPARVLDVGAGTGFLSLLLAGQSYKVTALDLSPGMLARLRAKAAERGLAMETIEGHAQHPPAGEYDAVVERHLLWTQPDPAAALAAWHAAAPAGRLVVIEGSWGERKRNPAGQAAQPGQGTGRPGPPRRARPPRSLHRATERRLALLRRTNPGRCSQPGPGQPMGRGPDRASPRRRMGHH